MPPRTPPPRLSILFARAAPVAVIFRRGPSKHVEVIRWDVRYRRVERFHVAAPDGTHILPLDVADWADWDFDGRLVVLRHGAVSVADVADGAIGPPRELIDFTADSFEEREPPASARTW